MKVDFACRPGCYRGKLDGLVFYRHEKLGRTCARRYVVPKSTDQNCRIGRVSRNLAAIAPSADWIRDMKAYLVQFNNLRDTAFKPVVNWTNLYFKAIYAMARQIGGIDPETLTREQIYALNLPCITVCRLIEANILPMVRDYSTLIMLI